MRCAFLALKRRRKISGGKAIGTRYNTPPHNVDHPTHKNPWQRQTSIRQNGEQGVDGATGYALVISAQPPSTQPALDFLLFSISPLPSPWLASRKAQQCDKTRHGHKKRPLLQHNRAIHDRATDKIIQVPCVPPFLV